jgi:hypothetical protein
MHLDIVEDLAIDDTPMPGKFTWRWAVWMGSA